MNKKNGITILGLGPGDARHLTREAWDWITSAPEIYLRTTQHPCVAEFPADLTVNSFDYLYESAESFENVYEQIITKILELGERPGGVTYAVPGHPFVAETTCPEIARRAEVAGIPVRVIEGLSFLEPVFTALNTDPFSGMALVDAIDIGRRQTPPFAPDTPALIAQIYSREVASELKLALTSVYPDEFQVQMVHAAGTSGQIIENLHLYEIDRSPHIGLMSVLFLPALGDDTSLVAFQEIVARLRAPDGCPWDREQTHTSLRQHLLEETYEALEALDEEDTESMAEEFGDILLQIVLHAQIASEEGEFSMVDVLKGINNKIIRRHPHVFGELKLDHVDGVLSNWEKLKAKERQDNGVGETKGLLDGVPLALPALVQAQEYQERAGRVGFDWKEIEPVFDKMVEEIREFREAENDMERTEELGDMLFALVNLVRWYKVDAESALRKTNQKFRRRFKHIEKRAREEGRNLADMTLEQMDVFWDEAKDLE